MLAPLIDRGLLGEPGLGGALDEGRLRFEVLDRAGRRIDLDPDRREPQIRAEIAGGVRDMEVRIERAPGSRLDLVVRRGEARIGQEGLEARVRFQIHDPERGGAALEQVIHVPIRIVERE